MEGNEEQMQRRRRGDEGRGERENGGKTCIEKVLTIATLADGAIQSER